MAEKERERKKINKQEKMSKMRRVAHARKVFPLNDLKPMKLSDIITYM